MSAEVAAAAAAPIAVNTLAPMEKPFDVKNLLTRIKANGLPAAEAALKAIAGPTIDWVSESCVMKGGAWKYLAPLVAGSKPHAMEAIDKIDGVKS